MKITTTFTRLTLIFSLIILCVISCGLFINSEPIPQKQTSDGNLYLNKPCPLPEKVAFAGEEIPLQNFDTRESLDRELLVNVNFHSQTILYLKKANRYFTIIDPILKKNGIPEDFRYLAVAESGLQERIVSPAGATGIWQLMKSAATEAGMEVNTEVDERYHIAKSTEAACRYLKNSYAKFGNWTLVAASYNAGLAGVSRQVTQQSGSNYYDLWLNEETARYIFRIVALKLIMENPETYGFQVTDEEKYPLLKTREVTLSGSVDDLAAYARKEGTTYKMLKYLNPWLRQTSLKNMSHKSYTLLLPDGGMREELYK